MQVGLGIDTGMGEQGLGARAQDFRPVARQHQAETPEALRIAPGEAIPKPAGKFPLELLRLRADVHMHEQAAADTQDGGAARHVLDADVTQDFLGAAATERLPQEDAGEGESCGVRGRRGLGGHAAHPAAATFPTQAGEHKIFPVLPISAQEDVKMNDVESLRRDIVGMVEELRAAMRDIGDGGMPEANVVSNTRDRLRYIAALTEQAAGRTLNAAEAIADRLRTQRERAAAMMGRTRSPAVRAFLADLYAEHALAAADASEIIQAQAFQDLVGQVVNKLLLTVQKMEDGLVHLLVDEPVQAETLAGPAVDARTAVSQADVDSLFG